MLCINNTGTTDTGFRPSELVVDFRNIQKLGTLTDHVVMDCTHAAQETQGNDGKTGGNRAYVPFFAKTAKFHTLRLKIILLE